jgi:hypothetical protein
MIRYIAFLAASLIGIGLASAQVAPANDYQFRVKELANIKLQEGKAQEELAKAIGELAKRMDPQGAALVGMQLAQSLKGAASPQSAPAFDIPGPPQPAPECGFMCSTGRVVAGLADFTLRAGAIAAPFYQANKATQLVLATVAANRDVQINEAEQRTAQLGVVRDTGIGVAGAVGGGYAGALNAALSRPTYSITTTGNGNTVAGRDATTTTTTTNTVECPQTASATGGQSGNAATGGSGGSAPGATGGNGGNSGAAAPPQVNQRTDCAAGR